MPAPFIQPSQGDVHVNRPLTNMSLAFVQASDGFVAGRVFANLPVPNKSDLYFTYDRFDFNRDEMTERAPGAESAGSSYQIGSDNYLCRVRAWHRDVADQIRANADDPLDLDREATEIATLKGLINRELNWVTQYFVTGDPGTTWTFHADGVTDGSRTAAASFDPEDNANNKVTWWNEAASTPIEDVRLGKRFVQQRTGFRPNVMVLGRTVFDTLLDHPDIVGRIDRGQTAGPAIANRQNLAALFELEDVLVMDSVHTTTDEGVATASQVMNFIGGKHALLCYRPPRPGIMTPAAGYTFSWTGFLGATNDGMRIKRFRMEPNEADRVEIQMAYDLKQVSKDLGYFFDSIVQ